MADEAKKKRAKREKDKLERDGRIIGNFTGPKNFIKNHKETVANHTADYQKYKVERFNMVKTKQIHNAKLIRTQKVEDKRFKDEAYLTKWIEHRFKKEIAIMIISRAKQQQARARLFF